MASFRIFILGAFIALNVLYAAYITYPTKTYNRISTYLSFKAALSAYELKLLEEKISED